MPLSPTVPTRAYAGLIIGLLGISFSAILVRWAATPGPITGFYRMAIAAVVMLFPFLWRHRANPARTIRALPRREMWLAVVAGLLFAGDVALWSTGVMLSGATNPTLVGNTAPLWVGLGAYFIFREKLERRFWIGLLVAVSGAMLILGIDALRDFSLGLGTLMGLGAGVFYGAYFLVTQRGRHRLDNISYGFIVAVSSSLLLAVVCWLLGLPFTGYSAQSYTALLVLGVVTQVLGQFSLSYALGFLPASYIAPIGLVQPVSVAILAALLLGEEITIWTIIGGGAILTGIYIVHLSRLKKKVAIGE